MQIQPHIGLAAIALAAVIAACGARPTAEDAADELVAGDVIDVDYDEDRLVCKRQRVIGSNVPRTVCKTESQIEAERQAAEKAVGPLRPMGGYTGRDPGSDPPR